MFWFGFCFVVWSYHCFGVSRAKEHNPSLVVASETRESNDGKQKSDETIDVGDERCLIA